MEMHAPDRSGGHRRGFLARVCSWFMGTGLIAGYGPLAAIAVRFLYPARPARKSWLYVAGLADFAVGTSLRFRDPAGHMVSIARLGDGDTPDNFIALSSVCPHLGCQVHWESAKRRFFCPCHNGAFDPTGVAIQGPPKEAGQSLSRYPLKADNGLLFIQVSTETLRR
jgi:cytochrome b6-f complex iron-sulfur subunit